MSGIIKVNSQGLDDHHSNLQNIVAQMQSTTTRIMGLAKRLSDLGFQGDTEGVYKARMNRFHNDGTHLQEHLTSLNNAILQAGGGLTHVDKLNAARMQGSLT
ncbi:WXG100 family type VII secretion target [Nocardia sp. NPDC004722]